MPKQILNLQQFHGGLSTNSDPRDIDDSELTTATDVMVDEIGKIRMMGGTAAHASSNSTGIEIEPGYGLFQFSHDRINGHLGEHLSETDFATHVNWDVSGDVSDSGVAGQLTFTFASGSLNGTAQQVYGDRLEAGIGGVEYVFTYTVAVTTAPDGNFALTLDNFPASSTTLPFTAGTHTVTFTSHANAATAAFTITATETDSSEGVFSIDNVSLRIYDPAETGDDYLALADDESNDPAVYIFSKARDDASDGNGWSESQTITLGDTSNPKTSFYYVDGALRVSDGNFGSDNSNKWHGYIDRTWFPNVSGYDIKQWYTTFQKIEKPQSSYYDKAFTIVAGETGVTDVIGTGGGNVWTKEETRANINTAFSAAGAGNESVVRCVAYYYYTVASGGDTVTIKVKAGPYDSTGGWDESAVEKTDVNAQPKGEGTHSSSVSFTFDAADTLATGTWAPGGGTNRWRCEITTFTGTTTKVLSSAIIYEGKTGLPELDSGGSTFTNGYATGNNVAMLFDWADTSNGLGWQDSGGNGEWNVGATFIYDEKQESQITELLDETDGSTVALDVASGENVRPAIILAIADPSHVGVGDGDGTTWNKRVTGCNIYMQDVGQDTTQPWYLQLSANFITGMLRVESTQKEYDSQHNSDAANQSYYYWSIAAASLSSPSAVTTYEANSGMEEEEKSVISNFKSAVVANRMAYIGGLQVLNEDGTKEARGDAIIKSLVNKFDTFPLSRVIEASVRDGDEIVAIEEYADRLLEFKKKKMSLINISQEIEFLEDTFMHKGVSHPAAVCKTDFGIAWVNTLGCYLYDGKRVSNLLEKGGRQIIKESDWDSFVVEPMIGYIPKKRQIIVVDDITNNGDGSVFLYDMVTQSWVKGGAATIADQNKTNFITDWNGDLVYAHSTGTILKWDDASDSSELASAITKDIDFGQPGVRKKVYRVYVTYKGASDTNMDVFFDVDGGTSLNKTFANGTNITSDQLDGSSAWAVAELKPSTSSQANNIKSFRLKFVSDGATPADFEINDISIAYRLKHIK